jgi:hypothetical protein
MSSRLTVVIFWLWLVIVRAAILCPEGCQCNAAHQKVSCYGPLITTVPLIRLTDLRQFVLSEYNLRLVERDSFVSLTELE